MTADKKIKKFLAYGVSLDLARKAVSVGLSVTTVKGTSQDLLVGKYELLPDEAKAIASAVRREPIDKEVVELLLERGNYTCAACKGTPQTSGYIIHHMDPYEATQDNSYNNLVVLCPIHHDQAHRSGSGLTLHLAPDQLRRAKETWEEKVEVANAQRAAQQIDVNAEAIDYFNVKRIEDLCVQIFDEIPITNYSDRLQRRGILDGFRSFDEAFVRNNLSGGAYLFDYVGRGEALHYKELLEIIAKKISFHDLNAATKFSLLREMEGEYAFFVGGVTSKRPSLPFNESTPPVVLSYRKRNVKITWGMDPNYLYSMSAISRMGTKQRYIIYCLIRSVQKDLDGDILIAASPLLISMPSHYINRTPAIAYMKEYERDQGYGLIDDGE